MNDTNVHLQDSASETGFPSGFLWGTATAAYQIEGAAREGGKGESIWDRFVHAPGTIADGSTGDIACDHYHRWSDDLDLMARLSHSAYRFSIAWSRVLPDGKGHINETGMDFYEQLVDGLLARGIVPCVTLYHWDLPQALQDRGGWENRDTASYFADFAQAVARRLGDRVSAWITHNEPHIIVYHGYVDGTKAPGLRNPALVGPISHHLLLSHGLACQALRAETPHTDIGMALNFAAIEPATDREADAEAARTLDGLWHRWFTDPLFTGAYPEDIVPLIAQPPDLIRSGDLETIAAPLDFLGVNYYTRALVRAGKGGPTDPRIVPPSGPLTTMGWEIYPEGLRATLTRLHRDYQPKYLYITENGVAFPDTLTGDGEVHDAARTRYLREHFLATRQAIAEGMPVRGFFVWSLLDNFEWSYGFGQRFGIVYTDYPTQRRIPKDSATWLARVAATNGGTVEE
ncbi:MAG: beta-glucosidase [Ktedonobacterales bacterium]|jgi:beta-glucosidase|nr:MAG: beta-glucosidase [Ktedonobacterales bacterium]